MANLWLQWIILFDFHNTQVSQLVFITLYHKGLMLLTLLTSQGHLIYDY